MKKEQVIRQDRIGSAEQNWVLDYAGNKLKITNFSAFGIACISDKQISKDIWDNCSINHNSFCLEKLSFKVARENSLNGKFEYGLEVIESALPVETMKEIVQVSNFIFDLNNHIKKAKATVPEQIRLVIYEMKDSLKRVDLFLSDLQKNLKFGNFTDKKIFEESAIKTAGSWLLELIRVGNLELNKLSESLSSESLNEALAFYRENLRDSLYQSIFAERCLEKPLGYAGDYEMMNLMYRNEDFGNSLFGRTVEYAIQKHPEPQAVRNRAEFLLEKLKAQVAEKPESTILSVASGPAFELKMLLEQADANTLRSIKLVLLDQDLSALKNAQLSLRSAMKKKGINAEVELINTSIKNVITTGLGNRSFDMIYSAGLFDYFQDDVAKLAAKRLLDATNANGKVIIGNFNIHTPNKFGMKIIFDWDLLYRSEETLKKLYEFSGVKNRIEHENNKINLFCILQKG